MWRSILRWWKESGANWSLERPGQAGGRGYKKTEDQPHALALTVGKNMSERCKTGVAHSPR
jgi:hypothetical protein